MATSDNMGVVFVCGAAGTGKTTLLSSFIREQRLERVGWFSLDEGCDNIHSFWLHFIAAVNTFLEDENDLLTLLRSNIDASHLKNLLIMLINHLAADEDYYLVLDDVHCLQDPALITTLEFFIELMPANLHLFMLSREDPPLYLGPLAMAGRLLYIDSRQMLLSPGEGLAFLRQTLALEAGDEALEELNNYAEGWIGGLQLAAAAGPRLKHPGALLAAGGGIAGQYLTREIFESLTEEEREFLLSTGFLSYFDADLVEKLLPHIPVADFPVLIENLLRKNLFIICLDEDLGIYRYHNILGDYLRKQLESRPLPWRLELHRRAAAIYEARGDFEEALREFHQAGDHDRMMRIVKQMEDPADVLWYLNRIPAEKLIEDADLAAQCFMYNLGAVDEQHCRRIYDLFAERYGDQVIFKAMKFAESFVKPDVRSLPKHHVLTSQEINELPFSNAVKAFMLVGNSISLLALQRYEQAEDCILQAINEYGGGNVLTDFYAYDQLAQVYEEMGRLNDSLACYRRALAVFNSPVLMSGIGINYYFGITGVHMLRMELDEAESSLAQAREMLSKARIRAGIAHITLAYHEAEMDFLRGRAEAAAFRVNAILADYPGLNSLSLGRLIQALDCAGLLSAELAERVLGDYEQAEEHRRHPFMRLLLARIIFGLGQQEEGLREVDQVLAFSRQQHNRLRLVGAGLCKIYMLSRAPAAGGRREIQNLLREALHHAHRERLLMPFYLERVTLLPFLEELISMGRTENAWSEEEADFAREVLTLCGGVAATIKDPDALSPRELEVVRELAKGITNREIGENLVISQATVKTHVLSIFGKLDVSSRLQAVEEARRRGIL